MHPDEKRRLAVLVQPINGVGPYLSTSALDAMVTALIALALNVEASIEKAKSSIETGRHAGIGIEDERADKRGSVIATLLQNFRHIRQQCGEGVAEISHSMKLG